jgi:hypothetical protein
LEKKLQDQVTSAEILEAAKGRPLRLMFQDEARFGRLMDPRRCWAPYPIRPMVSCAVVREFTYAYAAVCPWDGVMDSLVLPEASTPCMNLFLEELAGRHPDEHIVLVMDGAGWHKANALRQPDNMSFLFLPPYSPELNPTEHLWDELREKYFHNEAFRTLSAVEDQLVLGLAALENSPALVQSITGWPWLVGINLIAN